MALRPLALEATTLRSWVLARQSPTTDTSIPKKFQIVDVRDDDYIGGHIPGSINIPSRQFGRRVPALVQDLKDFDAVVFTCALSQQRGPNAARDYFNRRKDDKQNVYVLKDGFFGWQARYGADKNLTEDWDKEVWEYY